MSNLLVGQLMVKLHGVFGGVALAEGGVQEDSKSRPKLCLLLQILQYFRKIVFLFSMNQKMYPTFIFSSSWSATIPLKPPSLGP